MASVPRRDGDWAGEVGDADTVRAVFDEMPVLLLGMAGPEHRIVAANAAFRATTGRTGHVGQTLVEAFPEMKGQQVYEMYDRVYRTGQQQVAREWHVQMDVEGVRTDGYYDFTVTPWRGPDGEIVGTTLVSLDVTQRVLERQAAQERAEVAERRYAAARDTIVTLQRELLPAGLPVLPGARLAATYLLADADTAAGGDWFDAVAMPGGRVALTVGDVVGHGVAASAVMGQLRAVLQDRLLGDGDIAGALAAVDRLARRTPGARAATVCVAVLDPADGAVTYCTAGHPPPLLINGDGPGRYLPSTGAGPLGGDATFPVGTARLAEGDLLVLFTDGLIERPGRDHAGSLVEVAQVAADAAADRVLLGSGLSAVQRVCTQTLELLVRQASHTDDVTMLAVQRVAPPPPLRLRLPARPGVIAQAYRAVGGWLQQLGVGSQDVSAMRHAVGELVTNCVEHAYAGQEAGEVTLAAELAPDGAARIEVSDQGRWQERPPATSGRTGGLGLVLADQLVDSLRLRPSAHGTTAEIRHALSTPGRLLTLDEVTAGVPGVRPPRDSDLLLILDEPSAPGPRVRVDGPITAATAGQLTSALQRLTRHGTRSLTVDLTGVTLLSSVGVAGLQDALRRSREHGGLLRLYAAPGSPAQHVLALTALAHTSADPASG
ncbi:serine phosphatase RsbU (regulator of sigma subunit) [Krasilnikovia cinnamomea]|uniref:Serine phosphatase RsbU (Regulator of sigma subunit) n=1 Tax=Krasilnikovia cinnamomea TaxID=349313 RepID=A0A4Q7ZV39_9ACTN|nr:SpoIIE family protein phosphatase [Krasilnikovia cinnamomea]RZU54455.1 serine phosphatase RsbU (regulator of sigma subunit) [Krasilnikovia cinnamomea]